MKRRVSGLLTAVIFAFAAPSAQADEGSYLRSLGGSWAGKGTVLVRTNSSPVTVTCRFTSNASASSLALDGNCRGLMVISRSIGSRLKSSGGKYTGTYTGSSSGVARLTGTRRGHALNLAIRWAKNVNGDRSAQLTLEKVGTDGMRLSTIDVDPATGKAVVTSEINLRRS